MSIWLLDQLARLLGVTIYVNGVRRGLFVDLGAECMA